MKLMEACKVLGYTLSLNDFDQDTSTIIDLLIAIKQSKIEKLEQYKHSLIYEYVTGKKEAS